MIPVKTISSLGVLKRFFKDTIIYGIAAVLPRVINFLLVPIHTKALSAETYSQNTNFYIWIAFFTVFLTFGMETAFFRFYNKEKKKDALIATSFVSIAFVTILFLGVFISFFQDISQFLDFEKNPLQLKLLIAILAIDTFSVIPFVYLRASHRPVKYMIIKLINVGVIFTVNWLFLSFIPQLSEQGSNTTFGYLLEISKETSKVNFIFIANLLGSLISFLLLIPYLTHFKWIFSKELLRKMLHYGLPVAVAGVAYVINENLDKWLIKQYIGDYAMGVYSACYKLAIFMNLYIMAFRLGAEPFFFSQAKEKNATQTYATILNYFTIIGAFFFIAIVSYIDILKELFIKNEVYWEAIAIVPIVLLANFFLGIYHNLSVWYKINDKTPFAMLFSIIGALVTIIANIYLIPKLGYIASAWATLLAYGSMMILSFFVGKKYYPVPYNLTKIGSYLLCSIVLSYVSFIYFRENYWISSLFILIFGALIYINERKELKQIFKLKKI